MSQQVPSKVSFCPVLSLSLKLLPFQPKSGVWQSEDRLPFAQEVSKLLCERPEEFGPSVLGVFGSLANHAGKAAFRKVSDEQILRGGTLRGGFPDGIHATITTFFSGILMNPLCHYEFTMTITAFNIIAAQDCGVGEIHLWSVWIEWQGSQPYSVSWWTTQKLDFLVLDLTDWHDRSIVWDGREENCRDMLQVLSGQEWCCWASLRPKSIGPRKAKNPHFAQEQHCTKRAGSVPEAFCRAQLGRNKVLEIVLCSLKQLFSKKRLQKQLWISVRPLNFKHKASVTISRSLEHDFLMLFIFFFLFLKRATFHVSTSMSTGRMSRPSTSRISHVVWGKVISMRSTFCSMRFADEVGKSCALLKHCTHRFLRGEQLPPNLTSLSFVGCVTTLCVCAS